MAEPFDPTIRGGDRVHVEMVPSMNFYAGTYGTVTTDGLGDSFHFRPAKSLTGAERPGPFDRWEESYTPYTLIRHAQKLMPPKDSYETGDWVVYDPDSTNVERRLFRGKVVGCCETGTCLAVHPDDISDGRELFGNIARDRIFAVIPTTSTLIPEDQRKEPAVTADAITPGTDLNDMTVEQLREALTIEREWRKNMGEDLRQEARNRDWCAEYESFARRWDLPTRPDRHDFTITLVVRNIETLNPQYIDKYDIIEQLRRLNRDTLVDNVTAFSHSPSVSE